MNFAFHALDSTHVKPWMALRMEGVRDFPLAFFWTEQEAQVMTEQEASAFLESSVMRGVFLEGTLVGFCGVRGFHRARTKHRRVLGPFFVTAALQGQGAAQCLMGGVIAEARVAGITQLELYVDTQNARAIRFYESYGFERCGLHPNEMQIDGVPYDSYFYRLTLD